MISCFPDPYPEEILYNTFARYGDKMSYRSKKAVVEKLLGAGTVIAIVDLPSHIEHLVSVLPPGHRYTVDYLIDKHTLLPFYAPFLPQDRLARLRDDMRCSNGSGIQMRTGIMASRIPTPAWLRFCPICVEEDRNRFGESFWHRVHQVPGVKVCPGHEVFLQNSNTPTHLSLPRYEFISAERAIHLTAPQKIDRDNFHHNVLLKVAQDAAWLLTQDNLCPGLEALHNRYLMLLAEQNLATFKGRVLVQELFKELQQYYSSSLLHDLDCDIDGNSEHNWLARLVRSLSKTLHPLYHLLLIRFLNHTTETFFQLPDEPSYFGKGPWFCLNLVCEFYQKACIRDCQIVFSSNVHGRPIGIFTCKNCGFSYSRTGPDRSPEDLYCVGKIKAFGRQWEEILKKLWTDPNISLRKTARQLGVDPNTVKFQAQRLGLPSSDHLVFDDVKARASVEVSSEHNLCGLQQHHQEIWLTIRTEYPDAGIKELRSYAPATYAWLYRNDRIWLQVHQPPRKHSLISPVQRVDWPKRDQELATAVRISAERLKQKPGRPTKITITAIARDIDSLAIIHQHLEKLPQTAEALKDVVETPEIFAVRRIWWAAEEYGKEKVQPKQWQIVRRAGVSRLLHHPVVQAAINEALEAL